jgi:hypothetical protein
VGRVLWQFDAFSREAIKSQVGLRNIAEKFTLEWLGYTLSIKFDFPESKFISFSKYQSEVLKTIPVTYLDLSPQRIIWPLVFDSQIIDPGAPIRPYIPKYII